MRAFNILHFSIVGLNSLAVVPPVILVIITRNYPGMDPFYFGLFLGISAVATLILLLLGIILSLTRNELGGMAWTSFLFVVCIHFIASLAIPAVT